MQHGHTQLRSGARNKIFRVNIVSNSYLSLPHTLCDNHHCSVSQALYTYCQMISGESPGSLGIPQASALQVFKEPLHVEVFHSHCLVDEEWI